MFPDIFWVYPDIDYAICLSADLKTGTFGHPWEQTICVFGSELIKIVEPMLAESGFSVLRRNPVPEDQADS